MGNLGQKRQKERSSFGRAARRSSLVLLLLILVWSVALGWGMSRAIANPDINNLEPMSDSQKIGQQLYLETCASCHVPIPPSVLPTETWRDLLSKPQNHYGINLPEVVSVTQLVIWKYLRTFSRILNVDEPKPKFVAQSRYFKALHPKVELPKPVTHQSCIVCHPNAQQMDYRTLTEDKG